MVSRGDIEAGRAYEVECPFVRSTYTHFDEDGAEERPSWKPGVDWEMCAPDDSEAVADGIGSVLYTVVSVHQLPKPYAARVFFVREWIDPDGKRFGKRTLRIMGITAFRRRLNGYWTGDRGGFRLRQKEAA